jgi:hypothetical protein
MPAVSVAGQPANNEENGVKVPVAAKCAIVPRPHVGRRDTSVQEIGGLFGFGLD